MNNRHSSLFFSGIFALSAIFSPTVEAQEPSLRAMRDFQTCADQVAQSTRWQNVHWQQNMDAAKAQAYNERKPILVVLHNNFGGDTNSHEC